MKKIIVLFVLCAALLYGTMICYADEQNQIRSLAMDLPLAFKYETKAAAEALNDQDLGLRSLLEEQQLNLNHLNTFYFLGYSYDSSFSGSSLKHSLEWKSSYIEEASIFQSQLYKSYYKLRTEKLLKKFQDTEVFDYNAMMENARMEFDSYMKTDIKNSAAKENLVLLLQEKLTDKLPELESAKRKAVFGEIMAFRNSANYNSSLTYVYQIFESRVRSQLLLEVAEINKQKLMQLTQRVSLRITANKEGRILLDGRDHVGKKSTSEILNVLEGEPGYKGLISLYELYGKEDLKITFVDNDSKEYLISVQTALEAIKVNEEGYLILPLDDLLIPMNGDVKPASQESAAAIEKSINEKIAALENIYKSKSKDAKAIVSELNRYNIYLGLKNKSISNDLTSKFEANKKSWKANLDAKLSKFGPAGMADFECYIKQFVLFEAMSAAKTAKGKSLIARFRNSDIQFRKLNDSSLWILDMLYKVQNMK